MSCPAQPKRICCSLKSSIADKPTIGTKLRGPVRARDPQELRKSGKTYGPHTGRSGRGHCPVQSVAPLFISFSSFSETRTSRYQVPGHRILNFDRGTIPLGQDARCVTGRNISRRHMARWQQWSMEPLLPKDATSPPGSGWCLNRCRPAIGRSLDALASVAIATCARCSCRAPG